ncbi:uncharacterized protein TNCV_502271 [Trichonephila clavipes]|nr:uncharacterized protein TNCV_502271 [Trichonephila clavipes]
MDVCKCLVPSRHGGTRNSRRVASLLVRMVEAEERREATDHPQCVLTQNRSGIQPNCTVNSMGLKATDNYRSSPLCCHEFHGPCSYDTIN